jgi:hypothetical protein
MFGAKRKLAGTVHEYLNPLRLSKVASPAYESLPAKTNLRADGALVDDLTLVHDIWEAKDSDDDLTKEVGLKFK